MGFAEPTRRAYVRFREFVFFIKNANPIRRSARPRFANIFTVFGTTGSDVIGLSRNYIDLPLA